MINHPVKDPISIGLGFLVTGILIFLAYQAVLLEDSLVKHRLMVDQVIAEFRHEIQENRAVSQENQDEIRRNRIDSKENLREILENRVINKENRAMLKQIEERILETEQEIKRIHPAPHGQ